MATFVEALNRRATKMFIDNDPSDIVLYRATYEVSASGAKRKGQPVAQPSQRVKLIYQGGPDDGIFRSEGGQLSKYEFVIVAEYDADIKRGDTFTYPEGSDQKWVVTGLQPYNGYEIKAGAVEYGGQSHGG